MSKIMTLEVLSSIKGAESSEVVDELFRVIRNAVPFREKSNMLNTTIINSVTFDDLRPDTVEDSSDLEKKLIRENFPNEKNGYLVVPKVIED